jgi:hypothetical protein
MNIFSIDLTHPEINFIRQALETVSIQGRDAKFCANLQLKLEHELEEITRMIKEEEQNKMLGHHKDFKLKDVETKDRIAQLEKELEVLKTQKLTADTYLQALKGLKE